MKKMIVALVLFIAAASCLAQPPVAPNPKEMMREASFLEGNWTGSGWIQIGPEGRSQFAEAEKIYWKLDSTLLIIEGMGMSEDEGRIGDTVHQAYATLSWDTEDESFHMRAYRSNGQYVDALAEIPDDSTFVWHFEIPNYGTTRYTITIGGNGMWHEIGEMSGDGQAWRKFMEMTLHRI